MEPSILFPVTPGLSSLFGFNLPSSEPPKYIRFKGKRRGKDAYPDIAIILIQQPSFAIDKLFALPTIYRHRTECLFVYQLAGEKPGLLLHSS